LRYYGYFLIYDYMDKELLKEAVQFISLELKSNPGADMLKLIERASQQFDLNPLQTEYLLNKYIFNK
jgi:hypothetical protein